MFDGLKKNNARWDMIGMSVYPAWANGLTWSACNTRCKENMLDMITRYQTKVMVVETGYDYKKPIDANNFLYDLIEKTKTASGLGVFYWEPEGYGHGYDLTAWDPATKKPTKAMDAFQGIEYTSLTNETVLQACDIEIYPNPLCSDKKLMILFNRVLSNSIISIINLNGQPVYKTTLKNQSKLEIDCSEIRPGIYFVQVNNSKQKLMKSFTIR
jgi:hypothetical protein